MAVLWAYFFVVLIWATTPLTIQWSSDSLSYIAAVLLRMSLALIIGLMINLLARRKLFAQPQVWKVYVAGAIGIFPNMPVVYWSAQFIPSGLVAVVFAMSPFVTGLMSIWLLKHNPFTPRRVLALLIAVSGLIAIFHHEFQFSLQAVFGIVGILSSCFFFGFSSVLVKKLAVNVDAFNQTLGALLFSLPGLLLMWLMVDGQIPDSISLKSLAAISYLSLFGSLLGAALFFYVLANMSPTSVSLITFMTPLLALVLGALVGHEVMSPQLWLGAALVVVALLLYLDLALSNWAFASLLSRNLWSEPSLQSMKRDVDRFK